MVAANPNGGGARDVLYDRNLQDAYDNMRWYRHLAADGERQYPGSYGSGGQVMATLKPIDWDKTVVESCVDMLAKCARDAEDIIHELKSLRSDVTEAWSDSLIEGKVQAVMGTLAQDYDTFHDTLKNMRKHGEDDVCSGMDDATGYVLSITEGLKTHYGNLDELPYSVSDDPALTDAKNSLERAVGHAKDEIAKLNDVLKSDKEPIHISSAPPPDGYH